VLVVIACLAACSFASYCGDGITRPGVEQCDTGMRCVSRSNILPWTGAGPSLGPRMVGVSFQYAVGEYGGPETTQLLYGMTILVGSVQIANQYEYTMECINRPSGVFLRIVPSTPVFWESTHAIGIEWTFGGVDCDTALNGTRAWTPTNLTSVLFAYVGAATADVWTLTAAGTNLDAAAYGLGTNAICGTECCDSDCKRTWATVFNELCPSATPIPPSMGNYFCQGNASCMYQNRSLINDITPTCGDGIVEAPEACDPGMWLTQFPGTAGVYTFAPGSPLGLPYVWGGQFYYSPNSPTIFQNTQAQVYYTSGPWTGNQNIIPTNSTYQMNCEQPSPTTLIFTTQAVNFVNDFIPQMINVYTYTVAPGVTCTTWAIAPISMLFQNAYGVLIDIYGNNTYVSTDINDAMWFPGKQPQNTNCCNYLCQLTGAGAFQICPYGSPQTIPATPDYVCQGAGNGICAEAPTASSTASISLSPSITSSVPPTPSASPSLGASQSTTSSASPSLGSSASPTQTGSSQASPSPTMTPHPTRKPQSTTPWIVFGVLSGYTCVATLVVLTLWYILWRQHMERHRRAREKREQEGEPASEKSAPEATETPVQAQPPAPVEQAQANISTTSPAAPLLKVGGMRRVRFDFESPDF